MKKILFNKSTIFFVLFQTISMLHSHLISMIEIFSKIINMFEKSSILDVFHGDKYACVTCNSDIINSFMIEALTI